MKPEMAVRSLVHRLGYRFRLHRKDLPGKPDLVFAPRKKVIFVHGCFWHQHAASKCLDGRAPKSNTDYWLPKLRRNIERDTNACAELVRLGWKILVVWECETRDEAVLKQTLQTFLAEDHSRVG
jgi:DNA mismatch endonuclease (patch repair protein)